MHFLSATAVSGETGPTYLFTEVDSPDGYFSGCIISLTFLIFIEYNGLFTIEAFKFYGQVFFQDQTLIIV